MKLFLKEIGTWGIIFLVIKYVIENFEKLKGLFI